MENLEDIYNQAITMLKAGHSQEEILENFDNVKNELAPLLKISVSLLTMPKNIVPTPLMQKKYAFSKARIFWISWAHTFKFAAAGSGLMLILSALAVTGYAASNSLPGHNLFALKRAEENAQLVFTISPTAKANLQIALAQKRLDEAKQIFSVPGQNNQQEQTAALAELTSQTSNAVAAAASIAKTDPQAQSNHPLLNSLQSLTDQQQSLLKQIKPSGQIKLAAQNAQLALNDSAKQLSEIKQTVAVASSDQSLTKLSATSTDVAILGLITKITADQITVEKTVFTVNARTSVRDEDGNTVKFGDLIPGQRVNVVGGQIGSVLVAGQILATNVLPAASPAQTLLTTPASTTTTPAIAKKMATPANDDSTNTAVSFLKSDPNIATGGFIVENPSPQYH
jgi:hypothetical protein